MQRIIKATAFLAAVVGGTVAWGSSQVAAQEAAPPITIGTPLVYEGTGCPPGSVTALEVSRDSEGTVLPIKLNEYEGFVTPSARYMTLNCKLTITVNVPAGYVTALSSISYFGLADLEDKVTGVFGATYTWAGFPAPTRSSDVKSLTGPKDNVPFTWKDTVSTPSWSRCAGQEKLTLNTTLTVTNSTNPARNGSVKLDRTDVDIASTLRIAFDVRRCP